MTVFKTLNEKPIIGVPVMMCQQEKLGKYLLSTTYTKNLESSGARVVPVFPNQPLDYYEKLFKRLNGLLIPGGFGKPTDFQKPVTDVVKLFYEWSIRAYNDPEHPTYWPIWGTCMGFEILATIAAGGADCLEQCQHCAISKSLDLYPGYKNSRLMKYLSDNLIKAMSEQPILPHLHSFCLTMDKFSEHNLDKTFKILGTNKAEEGFQYVTAMEAHSYPFYAVMSHQEKAIFQRSVRNDFNKSPEAIQLGQMLMNFFVEECSKNDHHFKSHEEEMATLIQNYSVTFTAPLGLMNDECYFFE